jgi:hypothetical protein
MQDPITEMIDDDPYKINFKNSTHHQPNKIFVQYYNMPQKTWIHLQSLTL